MNFETRAVIEAEVEYPEDQIEEFFEQLDVEEMDVFCDVVADNAEENMRELFDEDAVSSIEVEVTYAE